MRKGGEICLLGLLFRGNLILESGEIFRSMVHRI